MRISWKRIRTSTGVMSTPPMVGTARWKGFRNGRVRAWKKGATGWWGFTQDSTAWMITAPMKM